MSTVTDLARRIAVNYPLRAEFIQACLDDFDGNEGETVKWLDVQAPTGYYVTPSFMRQVLGIPNHGRTLGSSQKPA